MACVLCPVFVYMRVVLGLNKLQNGVILFQNLEIPKYTFYRGSNFECHCELYYNDVTVTSFINIKASRKEQRR